MNDSGRRWSLAAAISSIAVFGIGIGVVGPLLSLLLERRGVDSSLNGLNAAMTFLGVILGPLLTPRLVVRFGFRRFLLAAVPTSLVLFLLLKPLDDLGAWFVLRFLGGIVGSSIFTATEAWISLLADDRSRGRIVGIYGASLSAGIAVGPLILSATGIDGWAPFLAAFVIDAVALVPLLLAPRDDSRIAPDKGIHPFGMMARMKAIVFTVALFGMYEGSVVSLISVWGARIGLSVAASASLLSAIFVGSIAFQIPVGWFSDRVDRNLALRVCAIVGVAGAVLIPLAAPLPLLLFPLLAIWGGFVSSIYPVALSAAGDRFGGAQLVSANAALVIGYGFGSFAGPVVVGGAMDLWNPHGIMATLALMFAALLVMTWWRGGRLPSISASSPRTGR